MTGKRAGARWLVTAALVLSTPFTTARAQDKSLTTRVETLLSAGIEPGAAHDTIAAMGNAGERALRAVFEREQAPRIARLRALGVLASFETESTARYFESLVRASQTAGAKLGELHPARSALVLRRALEGLLPTGRLLMPRLDSDAVTWCLTHADAHVRRVAAELLATLDEGGRDKARVDGVLSERLSHERSRMVRGSVARALTSRSVRSTDPR